MDNAYSDFWSKASPGLLDLGLGLYNRRQAQGEAASRLGAARGPVYDQTMNGASGMLTAAGTFDPQAFAANRYNAYQSLVQPVQQKQLDDLTRSLYAKGLLGVSSYNPGVEGITPNGTAMNPHLAAFYAAQNAANQKAAYNSLDQGQAYLDNLLHRSGMLTTQAGQVQNTGLAGQRTQPSAAASNAQLLQGAAGILKNTGVLQKIPGMIGSGIDWLGNQASNVGSFFAPSLPLQGDFGNFDFNFG